MSHPNFPSPAPRRFTISCPADAAVLTPYLLGFHPADSLVVLAWRPDGMTAIRIDLPVTPADAEPQISKLYHLLIVQQADAVLLLGYGPHDRVVPFLRAVDEALESVLTVKDVMRVHDGRCWSRQSAALDDPEGVPFDPGTSPLAAQAVAEGLVALPSRDDLASMIEPVTGTDRTWMKAETERAFQLRSASSDTESRAHGLRTVAELVPAARRLTDREAADLIIALTDIHVRDEAWIRGLDLDPHQQIGLWADLTRRAIGPHAAAPAALLAFHAYLNGNGPLALLAARRSTTAVPGYNLACLIEQAVTCGLPLPGLRESLRQAHANG